MTSASARIHVDAGDKATARYVTDGPAEPHVVLEWDDPRVSLFLPADVDTLDQHIAQLQMVRDGVAMSQGVRATITVPAEYLGDVEAPVQPFGESHGFGR